MIYNFEPPTGGRNARDNMDVIPQNQALGMVNLIPENGYLRTRGGSLLFAEHGAGPVETLVTYNDSGTQQLISAHSGSVYNCSSGTPVEIANSFNNDRWQTMMMNHLLIMVNGEDAPQGYNGTSVSALTITLLQGDKVTPAVGIAATDLWGCNQFKGRAFYWAENEQRVFFADLAGGHQGDLIEFDFASLVSKGGTLVSMMTYSRDSGSGEDDLAVFHFDTGDCLVFKGDDPGVADAWSLVQKYSIGKPVSVRANTDFGGDQIFISSDGFNNLSTALPNQKYSSAGNIGDNIINDAKFDVSKYKNNFGWEVNYFPAKSLMIFNVPKKGKYHQHVLNTATNAWCEFQELEAITWAVYNDELFFGDPDGNIQQAEKGAHDNSGFINWKLITSFTNFGLPGHKKRITGAGVTHNFFYGRYLDIDVLEDYVREGSHPLTAPPALLPMVWDAGAWDLSSWSESQDPIEGFTRHDNYPAGGTGLVLAIKLRGMSKTQEVSIFDLQLRYTKGGRI